MKKKEKIVVIGGGFVGQLVQLAVPTAHVLDWRKTPPANHLETRQGPQYLWEPIPGVPSTSFDVITLVDGYAPTPETILAYKKKIGKEDDGGDWGLQFQHKTTGWHSQLPKPRIEYGRTVRMIDLMAKQMGLGQGVDDWEVLDYDILINTIPLPAFLSLLIVGPTYQTPFKSDPIFMSVFPHIKESTIERCMILNYISNPLDPCYRITSVLEDNNHVEYRESLQPLSACKRIAPGKIHPHPENELMLTSLALHDCFCFGRFATWRPDELAHQTWKEIEQWKTDL